MNNRNSISIKTVILAVVAGLMTVPAFAADESLVELVPADALAVIHVANAAELPDRLAKSPLGKLWNDPKIQKFIAPGMSEFEEEVAQDANFETGFKLFKEILAEYKGEAVFSVNKVPIMEIFELGQNPPPGGDAEQMAVAQRVANLASVTMLGKIDPKSDAFTEKITSLLTLIKEAAEKDAPEGAKVEIAKETVDGQELHSLRLMHPKMEKPFDVIGFAKTGDVGVVGLPRAAVEASVQAVKKGLKGDSIASGSLSNFRERSPKNDVLMHIHLAQIMKQLLVLAKKAEDEGMFGAQMAAMGVTVDGIYNALGLGDLLSLDMGTKFEGEATEIASALQFTKRSGLTKLLAYTKTPAAKAAFIPEKVSTTSVLSFSLNDMWAAALQIVKDISPNLSMMMMQQLQMAEGQLGVKIDKDLLGNLSDSIITVETMEFEDGEDLSEDMVIMLGLKNEQGFEVALGKILTFASGMTGMEFEESEFLGHKLHSLVTPDAGAGALKVSYLFTKGYAIVSIGKGATLRKILSNMKRPGKSLWDVAQVKQTLAGFKPGYSDVSYVDLASVLSGLTDMFSQFGGGGPFDWDHKPTLKELQSLVGVIISATYIEDKAFFGKGLLLPQ